MRHLEFVLRKLESRKEMEALVSTTYILRKRGEVQLLLEEINQQFMEYRELKTRQVRRNRSL
jgi:hypothetical protein